MARYSASIVEEVRSANDIVSVVGEYVRLQKSGREFIGLCPFHREKTPSFSVVPSEQFYYCFGCQKGGDVIHFIMESENLDWIDALAKLAERARITLPEPDGTEDFEKAKLREQVIKINTEAARFFYSSLHTSTTSAACLYLKNRGISRKIAKRFGLGYSPPDWDTLYKYLLSKGFDKDIILKSGLVIPSAKGMGMYDRFRNRVMFPIFDIRGNVIGFGGRIIGEGHPKYINSSDTPVYSKGRNLYALNFTKNILKKADEKKVLVVEGYMDVISLYQAGIENVVASLGTALTESQGRLLQRYAEEIIISYDSDSAGKEAAIRGIELLDSIGCRVKVLELSSGKDPDDFIKSNGAASFRKAIDNALNLVDYKVKILKNSLDLQKIEHRIKFMNETANILAKISNNVEREIYIRKAAKDNDISEEALSAEVMKKVSRMYAGRRVADNNVKNDVSATDSTSGGLLSGNVANPLPELERMLLVLLCKDNTIIDNILNGYKEAEFDKTNEDAFKFAFNKLKSGTSIAAIDLISQFTGDEHNSFAKLVATTNGYIDISRVADDILKKIKQYRLDLRKNELIKLIEKEDTGEKAEQYKTELKKLLHERMC